MWIFLFLLLFWLPPKERERMFCIPDMSNAAEGGVAGSSRRSKISNTGEPIFTPKVNKSTSSFIRRCNIFVAQETYDRKYKCTHNDNMEYQYKYKHTHTHTQIQTQIQTQRQNHKSLILTVTSIAIFRVNSEARVYRTNGRFFMDNNADMIPSQFRFNNARSMGGQVFPSEIGHPKTNKPTNQPTNQPTIKKIHTLICPVCIVLL